MSAGYFNSEAYPRPTGTIPVIPDPRVPGATVGGARYPDDGEGPIGTAFKNRGTSQPKFDLRFDQELGNGSRLTYQGGVAGTDGIIYTGLGPFDIQGGSYMGYAKVNYTRRAVRVSYFSNFVDAKAPNLLLLDPATRAPLQLDFSTQTHDFEVGDAVALGTRHVVSFGGNVRRNNFKMTIAPALENRTEVGAYGQDEIIFDRVRLTIGARVDKFGNLDDPVFSPRLAAVLKASANHSVRLAFNKAFRSPSVINNYLDTQIVVPTDLSALGPLLPPPLQPLVATPFPLVVHAVGSKLPIGSMPQGELTEESLTAYEVAYTGTFADRTTVGVAVYVNDLDKSINFTQLPSNLDPYTVANPPPGWPLPPALIGVMAARGIYLPRTAFTYLNLGPIRQKGVELSVDHRVSRTLSAFANYSWQARSDHSRRPEPVSASGALASTEASGQRRVQFRPRPLPRQPLAELYGQGILERCADERVPRVHGRLHDGQRKRGREMAAGPDHDAGEGEQHLQQGHPAARLRRHHQALGHLRSPVQDVKGAIAAAISFQLSVLSIS